MGFTEYNGTLKVHSSLLNIVLYDSAGQSLTRLLWLPESQPVPLAFLPGFRDSGEGGQVCAKRMA